MNTSNYCGYSLKKATNRLLHKKHVTMSFPNRVITGSDPAVFIQSNPIMVMN